MTPVCQPSVFPQPREITPKGLIARTIQLVQRMKDKGLFPSVRGNGQIGQIAKAARAAGRSHLCPVLGQMTQKVVLESSVIGVRTHSALRWARIIFARRV